MVGMYLCSKLVCEMIPSERFGQRGVFSWFSIVRSGDRGVFRIKDIDDVHASSIPQRSPSSCKQWIMRLFDGYSKL